MNFISRIWLKKRQDAARKILKGPKVLDIGCGEYKIVPEATGLDVEGILGIDKVGSAESLPFPNESFDTATMLEVIEHLKNPEKALQEIKRILKPGGQVIISTPNVTILWKVIWFLWSHTFGRKWLGTHSKYFNEKTLSELFSKHFKIKNINKTNFWILILEGTKD